MGRPVSKQVTREQHRKEKASDEMKGENDCPTSHSSRPVTMVANIREGFSTCTSLPPGG